MTKRQLVIFVAGVLVVTVMVGVSVGAKVGLEQAFQAALTAALVYVTATYVFITSQVITVSRQQAKIMEEDQLNSAAPVLMLDVSSKEKPAGSEVEINVGWMNIGKGPALNFRCWIEDPEHPELRVRQKAICHTAIEVALNDVMSEKTIHTGIPGYRLGVGYIRAQYESIFKKTYESCLFFPTNAAPELKYGKARDDDIVIL